MAVTLPAQLRRAPVRGRLSLTRLRPDLNGPSTFRALALTFPPTLEHRL